MAAATEGRRRHLTGMALTAVVLTSGAWSLVPSSALAKDDLKPPDAAKAGTYAGVPYITYAGVIKGKTSTGAYRVPYQITAPANPRKGNHTVLVEPPHAVAGLGALDRFLGRPLLFGQGFTHAGIGWSTARFGKDGDLRILDPSKSNTYIRGGRAQKKGRTDPEIIADFAHALEHDRDARGIVGRVARRYVTGFSESSTPVLDLLTSGEARNVFDLAIPFTTGQVRVGPQPALADGRFRGKLIVVNSQWDVSTGLVDRGKTPNRYRLQVAPGTPHIQDPLVPFFTNTTTPASWQPTLRASFLDAHHWVTRGIPPPPSTHLKRSGGELVHDVNGNAIAVDNAGRRVPRLPIVELGEARFKSGFVGSYKKVKTLEQLGFASSAEYLRAFDASLDDYVAAGYILKADAEAMRRRAGLCPGLTFTETYRDHYERFVGLDRCRG